MATILTRKSALLATTILAATAFSLPPSASAQERIRERLDTDRVLGTVEVTTQKREQNLQDVPISVRAFNAEDLATFRIDGFDDLSAFTPGLIASPNPAESSGLRLAIRGIGVNDPQIGLDATVGLYVNGIYVGKTPGLAFDTPDLESVEVVKGPQGTLFGRNAVAGAISINTKGAEIGEWSGHATTEFGNFDSFGYRGAVNVPIGDRAAIKIAGLSFERDGYVENVLTPVDLGGFILQQGLGTDFGGIDRSGITVDLAWEPLDNFRLEYGFEDARTVAEPLFNQAAPPFGLLLAPTLNQPTPPLVPITDGRQDEVVSTTEIFDGGTEIIGHRIEANYDWNDDHSTKFLVGYRRADSNAFATFYPELNQFVFDALLSSPQPLPGGGAGPSLLDTFNALPMILGGLGVTTRPDFNVPLNGAFNPPFINGPFATFGTTPPQGNPVLDGHEQLSFELTQTGSLGDRINYTFGAFYFDEETAAGPIFERPGEAIGLAQLFPALGFLQPINDVAAGLQTVGAALQNPMTPPGQLPGLQAQFAGLQAQLAELTSGVAGVLTVARAPGSRIELDTEAYAVYGDVTFALTDQLSVTGGLRYSRDNKTAVQQGFSSLFNDTTDLLGNPIPQLNGDESFDSLDPRVVVEFTPTDDLLFYASYSQAFRSGGFNQAAISQADFNFDEERIRSGEVGVKSDLFNGRIRLNGAVFASFLDDQQFSFTNPAQPVTRFIGNNDSRRIGFEIDGQFVVGDFLTASAAYTYLDAEADDFINPFTGANLSDVDQAPRNSYSINLDYVRPVSIGEMQAHIGFNHKDASSITGAQLTGQNLLDARLAYTIAGEGNRAVTIFAYGQNLTDDEYTIDSLNVLNQLISNLDTFGLPRTYGGGITISF